MPGIQTILIQRLAEGVYLIPHDRDLGLANLLEVTRPDVTDQHADDDDHHQKLQQSETGAATALQVRSPDIRCLARPKFVIRLFLSRSGIPE